MLILTFIVFVLWLIVPDVVQFIFGIIISIFIVLVFVFGVGIYIFV